MLPATIVKTTATPQPPQQQQQQQQPSSATTTGVARSHSAGAALFTAANFPGGGSDHGGPGTLSRSTSVTPLTHLLQVPPPSQLQLMSASPPNSSSSSNGDMSASSCSVNMLSPSMNLLSTPLLLTPGLTPGLLTPGGGLRSAGATTSPPPSTGPSPGGGALVSPVVGALAQAAQLQQLQQQQQLMLQQHQQQLQQLQQQQQQQQLAGSFLHAPSQQSHPLVPMALQVPGQHQMDAVLHHQLHAQSIQYHIQCLQSQKQALEENLAAINQYSQQPQQHVPMATPVNDMTMQQQQQYLQQQYQQQQFMQMHGRPASTSPQPSPQVVYTTGVQLPLQLRGGTAAASSSTGFPVAHSVSSSNSTAPITLPGQAALSQHQFSMRMMGAHGVGVDTRMQALQPAPSALPHSTPYALMPPPTAMALDSQDLSIQQQIAHQQQLHFMYSQQLAAEQQQHQREIAQQQQQVQQLYEQHQQAQQRMAMQLQQVQGQIPSGGNNPIVAPMHSPSSSHGFHSAHDASMAPLSMLAEASSCAALSSQSMGAQQQQQPPLVHVGGVIQPTAVRAGTSGISVSARFPSAAAISASSASVPRPPASPSVAAAAQAAVGAAMAAAAAENEAWRQQQQQQQQQLNQKYMQLQSQCYPHHSPQSQHPSVGPVKLEPPSPPRSQQ
jgi:hypothetical protein